MNSKLNPNDLALVHLTQARPVLKDGLLHLQTRFKRYEGFSQSPSEGEVKARQTLHYTLQSPVTDHAYGQFEGRPWAVVAPMSEALSANGVPETMLASDVAFFPQGGEMALPGAVLVEFNKDLPSDVFIDSHPPNHLKVNTSITSANIQQAKQWFSTLHESGYSVDGILNQLNTPNKEWTSADITEMGVTSALASIKKPSLEQLRNIQPGSPMGFDGWMPRNELETLATHIESTTPLQGMNPIQIGRHDGADGDKLFSIISRRNSEELQQLFNNENTAPRIKSAADDWYNSRLYETLRAQNILSEMESAPMKTTDDLGRERPGLVSSMFGPRANGFYDHPTMGAIELDEVEQVLKKASPEQKEKLMASIQQRSQDPNNMPGSLLRLGTYLKSGPAPFVSSFPPPPPPVLEQKNTLIFSPPPPPSPPTFKPS